MRYSLFGLTATAAAFGLLVPTIFGFFVPDYSPFTQYISELGAHGSPHANVVNWGIFFPTALLNLFAVIALFRQSQGNKLPVLLLLGLAAGNLGATLFPCDAGCPPQGSPTQAIHNLIGLVQYVSGAIALLAMSSRFAHHPLGRCLGLTVFVSLVMMGGPGIAMRGLWQRIAELCLYAWLPVAAYSVSSSSLALPQSPQPPCARPPHPPSES
jgi:hypothetical membrane protein